MSNHQLSGSCLCGAVKVTAAPQELHTDVCHCSMCRNWGGSPAFSINCTDGFEIADEAAVSVYSSSDWAERGFCKVCGTHLFYRMKDGSFYSIPTGLFGDVEGLELTLEIYVDEKPDYYDFAGDTKKMTSTEVMALFGFSEES
ncbi:MAG: GFA family protein [Pseudomonadota bacterium]